MVKIKVSYIKNPINGWIFVQTKNGTGFGWGTTENEARINAINQIGRMNRNRVENEKLELEFVTPRELYGGK